MAAFTTRGGSTTTSQHLATLDDCQDMSRCLSCLRCQDLNKTWSILQDLTGICGIFIYSLYKSHCNSLALFIHVWMIMVKHAKQVWGVTTSSKLRFPSILCVAEQWMLQFDLKDLWQKTRWSCHHESLQLVLTWKKRKHYNTRFISISYTNAKDSHINLFRIAQKSPFRNNGCLSTCQNPGIISSSDGMAWDCSRILCLRLLLEYVSKQSLTKGSCLKYS
jgi:hypothetical protein